MNMRRLQSGREYSFVIEKVKSYNPNAVILLPDAYRIYEEEGKIIGFGALVKITWYASEIRHLFVLPGYRNKGYGTKIVRELLGEARTPLVLATTSTPASERVVIKAGFEIAHEFINPATGNLVKVFIFKKEV